MELYAFGDEMLNEETFGLLPARSPLKQRHALLGFLRRQLVNGVIFALAIWAGSGGLIGPSTADWIVGVCGFLFLAFASVSTFALPFWWLSDIRAILSISSAPVPSVSTMLIDEMFRQGRKYKSGSVSTIDHSSGHRARMLPASPRRLLATFGAES